MNREDLLAEMKEVIGTQSPRVFFDKMVDVLGLLFDKLDHLEKQLKNVKQYSALGINWDSGDTDKYKVAFKKEIEFLRKNGKLPDGSNIYSIEIEKLEEAYNLEYMCYNDFCRIWKGILGYHPFLEARDE